MNDAYWRDVMVGLYKTLKLQQEMIQNTSLELQALSEVLQMSPQFAEIYKQHHEDALNGPTAKTFALTLKAIDASIAGLMTGGKSQKEN